MSNSEQGSVRHFDDGRIEVKIDRSLFSDDAVKAAAYRLASDCGFALSLESDTVMLVEVRFKTDYPEAKRDEMASAFLNEIIDEDLRIRVRTETEATRNLILAAAFSKTNLL